MISLLTFSNNNDTFSSNPILGWAMLGKTEEYRPGRWRVRISWKGRRYEIYRYEKMLLYNQEMAQRVLEHYRYEIDHNLFDGSKLRKDRPFLFDKAAQTWIDLSTCSPEWLKGRRRISDNHLIRFFGNMDLREVRKIHIDQFVASLKEKKLSDKYIYNIIGELKALFNFHRESIPQVPAFPQITYQEATIRWLTAEQQDQIFGFIPERDLPIFTFMRWTGCRPNEAAGLLRENIFLKHTPPYFVLATVLGESGQIKFNTKTKLVKPLPIIPEIEWTLKPKEATRFVFSRNGRPYSKHMMRKTWESANKKANTQHETPMINLYNGLKHSFGCQRLNAGISLDEIRAVMGHADIKTTARYAKYAVEKLSSVMRGEKIHNG